MRTTPGTLSQLVALTLAFSAGAAIAPIDLLDSIVQSDAGYQVAERG
jgi:hypothetical protein